MTTNSSSGWTLNGKTGFYNSSIVYCQLLSEYVISCACVLSCYAGAFCFVCFGTSCPEEWSFHQYIVILILTLSIFSVTLVLALGENKC